MQTGTRHRLCQQRPQTIAIVSIVRNGGVLRLCATECQGGVRYAPLLECDQRERNQPDPQGCPMLRMQRRCLARGCKCFIDVAELRQRIAKSGECYGQAQS